MSQADTRSLIGGYLFILFTILFLVKLLLQRNKFNKLLSFLMIWVIVTFMPTWLLIQWYMGGLIPGVTGRYLTIPSIAIVLILSIILSNLRNRLSILFLIVIILSNIRTADLVIKGALHGRSVITHNLFWDTVDKTVPKDHQDRIFLFTGSTSLASELYATFSIPFGLRRGINQAEDLPITTYDRELVKKLLCEDNVSYQKFFDYGSDSNIFGPTLQKEKIPISHLYVWKFYEDSFVNVTEQEKILLRSEVDCKLD